MKKTLLYRYLFLCLAVFCLFFTSCDQIDISDLTQKLEAVVSDSETTGNPGGTSISIGQLPEYSGEDYIEIDNNQPGFTKKEKKKTKESFEQYSELDSLGRCGVAYANIGQDLMPAEKRSSIGSVKPTGWHTVKYDIVDGKFLYNRCHLIGYQLTAENANEKNLITGTRHMNVEGMLPFENMVTEYVQETDNHVLYRVTPIFDGENLVANGVQMEAYSVEDAGEGICFNVFVYNVQPGILIDYATGDSKEDNGQAIGGKDVQKNTSLDTGSENVQENTGSDTGNKDGQDGVENQEEQVEIRGNSRSMIYHCPGQAAYEEMADSPNLVVFHSEQEALDAGYRRAKR